MILVKDGTVLKWIILTCSTLQTVNQSSNGSFSFSGARCIFAAVLFLIVGLISGMKFTLDFLPYSLAFAVAYTCAILFFFLAISEGSLSLTTLITSYSLILPTLYGILFLNDKVSSLLIIGLILLVISLTLVNFENKNENKKSP